MRTFVVHRIQRILIISLILLGLQACATNNAIYSKSANVDKPIYHIYLAGPEVFLPDPVGAGVSKKATIQELNKQNNWPFILVGLYPMDNEIENFAHDVATGMKIYHANIDLMNKADYITANMVRFRGPSMDVGTAFEMGYMRGANKPVFAYYDSKPFYGTTEQAGLYAERIAQLYPINPDKPGVDIHGQSIENFKMEDNLMMIGALESGEGRISDNFKAAVLKIAEHIQAQ